ncbi:MAG: helix-turn-helix transcriptional regulator [Actinomycetia bacterium]|nr:helix-turn-helix transcriptional regulator [Actinomycetes bacterium]
MSEKRSYRLLCPIARALDVIGDRWTLLILRDLHAGPARYQELQEGLGMATNLLSTRLVELTTAGLIQKPNPGRSAYELTALGRRTDRVLWELTGFGSLLDPDPDPREPANLRTMALPLRMLFEPVWPRANFAVRLLVDDDTFTITSTQSGVEVEYGPSDTIAQLTARLDYTAFLELAEGRIDLKEFVTHYLETIDGADYRAEFLGLLSAAFGQHV